MADTAERKKMGIYIKPVVFYGPTWSAQITVQDYSDCPIWAWRNSPVRFVVVRKLNRLHKNTTFSSSGVQIYYGESFVEAVKAISATVRRDVDGDLPLAWKRYEIKAAKDS